MKPEEAINELLRMKRVVNFHSRIAGSEGVEIFISNDYRDEFIGVMDTAIAATEKQVAKKPINDKCENCGEDVRNWTGDDNFKYCPNCGQRIDWGNEE